MSIELIEELTGIVSGDAGEPKIKISEGKIRGAFKRAFQDNFAAATEESDQQIIAALASMPLYQMECIALLESELSKDDFAELDECYALGGAPLVEAWVDLRERPHSVRFLGEEILDELLGIFKKKPPMPQRTGALSRPEKEALVKKRFGNSSQLGVPARKQLPQSAGDPLAARQAANPGFTRTMSRGTSPDDKSKISVRKGGDFVKQHFGKDSPLPRKSQEKATHEFGMGQLGPQPKANPAEVKTGAKAAVGVANKMVKAPQKPMQKSMASQQSQGPGMMSKIAGHAGNIAASAGKHLMKGAAAVGRGALQAGGAVAKHGVGMAHRALAHHMAKLRNKHPGLAHVFFGKLGHGSAEHDAHELMGTSHQHLPGEKGSEPGAPKAAEPVKKPEGGSSEMHPEMHHHIQRAVDAALEKHGIKRPAEPGVGGGAEAPAKGREQHLQGQLSKHQEVQKATGKKTRTHADIEKELASKVG